MRVEVVATTDDPADTLEYHREIRENSFGVKVLPAWRPDKAMAIGNPKAYNEYLDKLSAAADQTIDTRFLCRLHILVILSQTGCQQLMPRNKYHPIVRVCGRRPM